MLNCFADETMLRKPIRQLCDGVQTNLIFSIAGDGEVSRQTSGDNETIAAIRPVG